MTPWPRAAYEDVLRSSGLELAPAQVQGISLLTRELVEKWHPEVTTLAAAAEMLWIVLANVSGGDWTQQSVEWQEAAARWRDYYFEVIGAANSQC